jgi:hypothetical protein
MNFIQLVVCFLSPRLLDKNHITSQTMGDPIYPRAQTMGDSFYHMFTTPYLYLLTLFVEGLGVGIQNVISKNYHMSDITLISRKICDDRTYMYTRLMRIMISPLAMLASAHNTDCQQFD